MNDIIRLKLKQGIPTNNMNNTMMNPTKRKPVTPRSRLPSISGKSEKSPDSVESLKCLGKTQRSAQKSISNKYTLSKRT